MLTAVPDADLWQSSQVEREFNDVLAKAGPHADTVMRLPDIKALLDRHLAGRPTRANFRTGTLTVCTMVPMRSVPHRVVCLVGLDDGVFPRLGVVDGDDALARDPMTGERDIRSEDRQLLLDAIGAATEKLVITYTGANEYSGQRKPPAVPLVELLDTLDITTPEKVRDRVLVEHPLQPFDVRNVTPGALGMPSGQPFTFDPTALTAAKVATGHREERPRLIGHPLPPPPPDDVALDDLIGFFKDPVKGFFRALDYTLPWDVDAVEDAMPVEIDALQEWKVGDRMLDDMLRGMKPDDARAAEWRRGSLPPGKLGWRKAHGYLRAGRCARDRRETAPHAGTACARRRHRCGFGPARHGHRPAVVRRPDGRGQLLEARRPAPAGIVDSPGGVDRSVSGPGVDGGVHRTAQEARPTQGATARSAGGSRRPLARPRRDVRRGPPRADPVAAQDVLRLGGDRLQPRCPDAGGGLAMEDRPLPR